MILAELLLGCKLWKNKNEISVIRDRLNLLKENPDQSGAEQIAKKLSLTSHFEELDPLLLKILKKTTRSRFENTIDMTIRSVGNSCPKILEIRIQFSRHFHLFFWHEDNACMEMLVLCNKIILLLGNTDFEK